MKVERRAAVVAGAAVLAVPLWSVAQVPSRRWRVGVLLHNFRLERLRFRELMPEIGLVEGRNLVYEVRSSEGRADHLDALATELVAAGVDVIVAPNNPEIQAAMRATRTIPILMLYAAAPVETGLVASLARPGGNVTGTTTNAPELAGKMVELLHDLLPHLRRIALLYEPDYPGMALYRQSSGRAAAALRLETQDATVDSAAGLDAALRSIERSRPDAVLVATTGIVVAQHRRIVEFMAAQRMPAIYSTPFAVRAGGLVSYAPDFLALARRSVAILGKILEGVRPAEIPVEQPAEFELVLNLGTARALGLAVPKLVLLRATEIID
jgi:putative ABC transport system substrate-binding protein